MKTKNSDFNMTTKEITEGIMKASKEKENEFLKKLKNQNALNYSQDLIKSKARQDIELLQDKRLLENQLDELYDCSLWQL